MPAANEWQAILEGAWGEVGDIEGEASSALLSVAYAVAGSHLPGSVAIVVTLKPKHAGRVTASVALKVVPPRERGPVEVADVFLADGALSLTDPRQPALALADGDGA